MSNSNHSAKFINMLIALMASIAIALTCMTLFCGIPASSSTRRADKARSPERFQLL